MLQRAAIAILAVLAFCPAEQSASAQAAAAPPEVSCYVDAVNESNLERLVACFAPEAVVIDVTRRFEGVEAIRGWAEREVIGGRVDVISVEPQEGRYRCLVSWAPGGSGGFRAWYTFTVRDRRITGMDLQYA
jgi:hypothetical protein